MGGWCSLPSLPHHFDRPNLPLPIVSLGALLSFCLSLLLSVPSPLILHPLLFSGQKFAPRV